MTLVNRSSRLGGAALAIVLLALLIVIPAGARPKTPAAPAGTTTVYDWGWENPLPQGNGLYGVSCPSTSLCKAVGESGTILSWNGMSWTADRSGTTTDLFYGVSCPSANFCKAVGYSGAILSWNGASWSADSFGTTTDLYCVSCPSQSMCKAVGLFGTVLSWNGSSWGVDSSGTTNDLYGISCPTHCKAVGDDGTIVGMVTQTLTDVDRQQRGKLVKLNGTLIPSVFAGTTSGHAYSFLDRSARRGVTYTYRLQAVSLGGTRAWLGTAVARR